MPLRVMELITMLASGVMVTVSGPCVRVRIGVFVPGFVVWVIMVYRIGWRGLTDGVMKGYFIIRSKCIV